MKILSLSEFQNRQLFNGEHYVLICDVGHALTLNERNQLAEQIRQSSNRFDIYSEWIDDADRYYVEIVITGNPIWGIVVILALGTVFVVATGLMLKDCLVGIGEVTEKAIPLALIGLVGLIAVVGYKWLKR
jgi:hypothetical protein